MVFTGNEDFRYYLIGMLEQNTSKTISSFTSIKELIQFIENSSKPTIHQSVIFLHSNYIPRYLPRNFPIISKSLIFVNMEKPQFIEEIYII